MATVVDSFPADHKTGRAVYPWHEWAALDETGHGRIIQITHGEDFHLTPKDMRASIVNRATRDRLRVKTAVRGDTVTFQFRAREAVAA